jgi:hypothetical protein
MHKVFCESNFCVGLHKRFDVLKTCQGAARSHTNKAVFLKSSTNQNQAYKVSFESHAIRGEYERPKQFFKSGAGGERGVE